MNSGSMLINTLNGTKSKTVCSSPQFGKSLKAGKVRLAIFKDSLSFVFMMQEMAAYPYRGAEVSLLTMFVFSADFPKK